MNSAPIGGKYEEDVGRKVSVRLVSAHHFASDAKEGVKVYDSAGESVLIRPTLACMFDEDPCPIPALDPTVWMLSPRWTHGLQFAMPALGIHKTMSMGLLSIFVALRVCSVVHVYGMDT